MRTIIISRVDAIGDVMLTLPMCGWIKQHLPNVRILFLCKEYTLPIVQCCVHVDEIVNYTQIEKLSKQEQIQFIKKINATDIVHVLPNKNIASIAKKAGIKNRIGTTHRMFHFFTCNNLIALGRKNSNEHEAQLNIKLTKGLGIQNNCVLSEIHKYYGFESSYDLPIEIKKLLSSDKQKIILHPKSHGSGREWGIENFKKLIEILPKEKYQIIIVGTEQEKLDCIQLIQDDTVNLLGKLSLQQYIALIKQCEIFIANSTGPLHIAAACGLKTIGLYPPLRPIFPARWAPLGSNAYYIVFNAKDCTTCIKMPKTCSCMQHITVQEVYEKILY